MLENISKENYLNFYSYNTEMETLKMIHKDIEQLKNDVQIIKRAILDEGELTNEAKSRLEKARKTPHSEYVQL